MGISAGAMVSDRELIVKDPVDIFLVSPAGARSIALKSISFGKKAIV